MACNNFDWHPLIIGEMHETMTRLYHAAALAGVVGQSDVARKLDQSPQTLNNWERRGMSKGGMLTAQRVFGCSAVWLESGVDVDEDTISSVRWILEQGREHEKSILLATIEAIKSAHKNQDVKQFVMEDRRKKA